MLAILNFLGALLRRLRKTGSHAAPVTKPRIKRRTALPRAPRLPQAPVGEQFPIAIAETALEDQRRQKIVPLRVTFPGTGGYAFPVIVFSHGAWGSKDDYALLIQYWAARGYVCMQPSHSDALAPGERADQDRLRNWPSRPLDVSFVLDSFDLIETDVPALSGRLGERVGVGGHSFGAGSAQLLAGASLRGRPGRHTFHDPRVRAVLLLSPQGSGQLHGENSWSRVRVPMMTITGTRDYGRGGGHSWRSEPFHGAPAGNKYLILVEGGQHDLGGMARSATSFPYAHDEREAGITQSASLAFWDAHLKNQPAAQKFLKGGGLEELLGADARLQRK